VPVIINEIEVLEQPATAQAPPTSPAPQPAPPAIPSEGILQLLRDTDGRQRRLVAD
jgi:hypothetical protein